MYSTQKKTFTHTKNNIFHIKNPLLKVYIINARPTSLHRIIIWPEIITKMFSRWCVVHLIIEEMLEMLTRSLARSLTIKILIQISLNNYQTFWSKRSFLYKRPHQSFFMCYRFLPLPLSFPNECHCRIFMSSVTVTSSTTFSQRPS